MLEQIRTQFSNGLAIFEKVLGSNIDLVDSTILFAAKEYKDHDGHGKMIKVIGMLLSKLPAIPAFISVMASQKIVDLLESTVQKQYDKLKAEGKI